MSNRLRIIVFYLALSLVLLLDYVFPPSKFIYRADPISWTAFFIALAVSAASAGGQYLISRLLAPRPRPQEHDRLSGTILLSSSAYGVAVPTIYGARSRNPQNDNNGGIREGTNYIWMSDIVFQQTTTPGSSGGGKGHPPAPSNLQNHYKVDIACLVGHGASIDAPDDGLEQGLRLIQIKFNDDVQYNILGSGGEPPPSDAAYEAEDTVNTGDGIYTTLAGGASIIADAACSNGFKVENVGNGGTILFHGLPGEDWHHQISVEYTSGADPLNAYVSIDGGAPSLHGFPASNGEVASIGFVKYLTIAESPHTLLISNPDAAAPDIDRIIVYPKLFIDPPDPIAPPGHTIFSPIDPYGPTGVENPDYPANATYDYFTPPSPLIADTTAIERYNMKPVVEDDGSLHLTLPNGCLCTIYEGNELQEPDPWIVANADVGSTPAYRGFCYIVFKNLEFTKYGNIPNITVVAEHKVLKTVETILIHRASKAGLMAGDLDVSAAVDVKVRGYLINTLEAPRQIFSDLGEVFNFGFRENLDGQIEAIDLSDRTVAATLSEDDLGAFVEGDDPPLSYIETTIPEFSTIEKQILVEGFNPLDNYQSGSGADSNSSSQASGVTPRSFPITLLRSEMNLISQRLLQKRHHEAAPHSFALTHKYAWLQALDRIALPIDGEMKHIRLMEISGSAPGVLKCSAVDDELTVIAGTLTAAQNDFQKYPVKVPANTVATFLDIPRLRDAETVPGVYIYLTNRDVTAGEWGGASAYRDKGMGDQWMANFSAPATMGVLVDAPGIAHSSGGFAPENIEDAPFVVDLYGTQTLESVTEDQLLDGANVFVLGNEVLSARSCVRDNDYPNRWVINLLLRGLKGTEAAADTAHAAGERFVFLNSAGRYIPLDKDEIGIERNWKFPSNGQKIDHCAVIPFTWSGASLAEAKSINTPTIVKHNGTGTGGSASAAIAGNDAGGVITIVTDAPVSGEIVASVSLAFGVRGTPVVSFGAKNANGASALPSLYYEVTASGFDIYQEGTLGDLLTYEWTYSVNLVQ